MKWLKIWISLLLVSSNFAYAEEDYLCQFHVAIDLCFNGDKNEGFLATKAALEKYQSDEATIMILRQAMVFNSVDDTYLQEMDENATEVIKKSSDPLPIGCAWFRRSEYALLIENYHEAIAFSSIALKTLEKTSYTAAKGAIPWRELYKCLCHATKRKAYEALGDEEKAAKENEIVNSFQFLNTSEEEVKVNPIEC
jgi:hypothetical protein